MKSLWTVRDSDGQLMKFDGYSWNTAGTYSVPNWTNNGYSNRQFSLFVYKGSLYAKFISYDGSQAQLYIAQWNGTTLSQVYNFNFNTGSEPTASCKIQSNAIEYKGKVFWFELHADTNPGYMYLCCFYLDGTNTAQFSRRSVTELGGLSRVANERSINWFGFGALPALVPFRDRIAMVPPITTNHGYNSNQHFWWSYNGSIDIDPSTYNVSPTLFLTTDTTKRYAYRDDQSNPPSASYLTLLDSTYCNITPWGDYLYCMTIEGKFYKVDPTTQVRTLIADYSTDSNFAVMNGQTYTTDSSNASYTISFVNTSSVGGYGFPWGYWETLPIKVKILNYNGTPGSTQWGYLHQPDAYNGSNNQYRFNLYDSSGNQLPSQPSGTQFQCYWTWTGANQSGGFVPVQSVFSCVYGGYLYIIRLHSRNLDDSNRFNSTYSLNPPSAVIRYDGTSTPTVMTFSNNGGVFTSTGGGWELDDSQGIVHYLGVDNTAKTGCHLRFTLGATTTMQYMGSVYGYSSEPFTGFFRIGHAPDSLIAFDPGDITATIESRTVDTTAKTITITYKLWGVNPNGTPDTCTIVPEFQINTGVGAWKTCTRKTAAGEGTTGLTTSSTGTSHTFVHDMNADYPSGFSGSVQHRIRVTSQTRN